MGQTAEFIAAKRCIYFILRDFDYEKRELNAIRLKELKNLVKNHSNIIVDLVDHLFKFVRQENSDRRLAILLICDHFFQRSHLFRTELTNSLQDFLVYTAETDPLHHPLPSPKEASNALKMETLKLMKIWHEKFSSAYSKLDHAYNFLRSSKAFDFERADAQLQVERIRAEEAQRRQEMLAKRVIDEVMKEMNERRMDIKKCLDETRSALELLVPKFIPDDMPQSSTSCDDNGDQTALSAFVGTDSISIVIPVEGPVIKRDESNEAIIGSLLDCVKLLHFYEKLLSRWIKKFTKFGGRCAEGSVKEAIDLKARVALELERCNELKLNGLRKRKNGSESESDDFEDVPEKEGLELEFKRPYDIPSHILARINEMDADEQSCSSGKVITKSKSDCSLAGNDDKRNAPQIPTLSFGLDLKYWGEKDVQPAEIPRNNSDCHRFWRPSDDSNTTCNDETEVYRSRVMTFVGEEQRATRQCRAPLRDGSLCPRMDKHKCPIHGLIVDRDQMGFPTQELPQCSKKPTESKEDEEYLRDVEAAIGVDLRFKKKGKRKKQTKKQRIAPSQEVRMRLEKKLLDRRTMKRVSATLDAIRKARAAKNFEHQFNYALSRT